MFVDRIKYSEMLSKMDGIMYKEGIPKTIVSNRISSYQKQRYKVCEHDKKYVDIS